MTVRIIEGDALEVLGTLRTASVQMCVTSPPYWGLRDYKTPPVIFGRSDCEHEFGEDLRRHRGGKSGKDSPATKGRSTPAARDDVMDIRAGAFCFRCGAWRGQLGLEPSPQLYVEHMVRIFDGVKRVLADDGVLWLNLGDCYASSEGQRKVGDDTGAKQATNAGSPGAPSRAVDGLSPKNLVMIPARVALALQARGWYLRAEIVWSKPNPMPESVTDRVTRAHEMLYHFSKSERYYYDAQAIAEPAVSASEARWDPRTNGTNGTAPSVESTSRQMGASTRRFRRSGNKERKFRGDHGGVEGSKSHQGHGVPWEASEGITRNKRSVWTVATAPYKEAHFATFPPKLIEPCILAGSKRGDVVLDPFGGAATTGVVCEQLGRDSILIELAPHYIPMMSNRVRDEAPLFNKVELR